MDKITSQENFKKASSVIPNFFTVGNLACGFFAIVASMEGRWIAAPSAIFVGHFLDILDGRIARWMKSPSEFGMQFDSFADWISFGIAPSVMVYLIVLHVFKELGFLLALFYVLCGALRLTRFNLKTSADSGPSLNFVGLPIPVAGGFLAILVLLFGLFDNGNQGRTMPLLYKQIPFLKAGIPVIMFSLSLLMISKFQYATFKKVHIFRPKSLPPLMMMLFVVFMIYTFPENTIFILYTSYIVWGFLRTVWRASRLQRRSLTSGKFLYSGKSNENENK